MSGTDCPEPGTDRSTTSCTSWPPSKLRHPTEGRAYFDRRKSEGKTSMEAMRALKRRLSNVIYRAMLDDLIEATTRNSGTGPGGQLGHDSDSSATGSHPN